jgi:inosine/xanthosine triphosphate pyrophosphatase family protein
MSIVRLGMAENKNYGDGYDAIFAKKTAKKPVAAKKPTAKKAPAKKPAKKK